MISTARILVVDDDRSWRELLALHLRRLGCDAVLAASVDEAIVALEAGPVDLVLSDQTMPGASGLDLLAYVRRRRPQVRFVLASGTIDEGLRRAALVGGAVDVRAKDELLRDLRHVLAADLAAAA